MYSGSKKTGVWELNLICRMHTTHSSYTLTPSHPHMHTPHTCTPISSSSGAGLNATRGEVKRKRYQSYTSVSRCIEAAKTISSEARLHTKHCSHLIGKRRQQTVQQPNRHRGTVGTHIKKFFFSKHFCTGGIEVASFPRSSLVSVFDCLQYAKHTKIDQKLEPGKAWQ